MPLNGYGVFSLKLWDFPILQRQVRHFFGSKAAYTVFIIHINKRRSLCQDSSYKPSTITIGPGVRPVAMRKNKIEWKEKMDCGLKRYSNVLFYACAEKSLVNRLLPNFVNCLCKVWCHRFTNNLFLVVRKCLFPIKTLVTTITTACTVLHAVQP